MAMMDYTPIWPLGAVKVVTPGTLVGLLDGFTNRKTSAGSVISAGGRTFIPGTGPVQVNKINFLVDPANVGLTYLGRKNFVRGTRVGLVMIFPPGSSLSVYQWDLVTPGGKNDIKPEDYYVDADNANDQLIVTCYMAGSR